MADNVSITPGTGAVIATDDVAGKHMQVVKLDVGGDGASVPIVGTAGLGVPVQIKNTEIIMPVSDAESSLTVDDGGITLSVDDGSGTLTVDDGGASLTVDSPQLPAALVSARLDVNLGACPVTVPVSAAQLPAALVDGRLDVRIGAAGATVNVADAGASLTVDDGGAALTVDDGGASLTVDGTVTSNQGTAAALSAAWPVKISDGSVAAGISDVSGEKALKVDVVQAVGSSSQTDKTTFTEGSGKCEVVAGVYNETISSDPSEDQAAAVRITAKRGLHVNLRNGSGTEVGTAGAPLRTDPTGVTTQPISGSVSAVLNAATNAGATAKTADMDTGGGTDTVVMFGVALPKSGGAVAGGTATDPLRTDPTGTTTQPVSGTVTARLNDEAGAAFSHTNPLPVAVVPQEQSAQWRSANTYAASETDIAIKAPTGGKKLVVCGVIVTCTGVGVLKIFDNSNAAANMLYQGQPAVGTFVIPFATPWRSAAANNVLRYSTGTSAAGDITAYGYEE